MQYKSQNFRITILVFVILILTSFFCQVTDSSPQTTPTPTSQVVIVTKISSDLNASLRPEIILQRLNVAFLGQDGKKVIGSGCPGSDGKGAILDYHFIVGGVDENKEVQRISVAGDHSTLTWASPCSNNWALEAKDLGNGIWEIFIAPSLPSKIYTVLFFYKDETLALGMVNAK
jgi:hypothetical protein